MTLPTPFLTGRRGWTAVASLTALLGALLVGQLSVTSAQADIPPALAPAAAPAAVIERPAPPVVPPVEAPPVESPPIAAPPAPPVAAPPVAAPPVAAPPAPVAPAPAPPAPKPAAPQAPVAAPPAPAAGLCSGAGWEQRRGEAALASLRAGAARTGFTVSFSGARSGVMGLTYLNENRIEMFVRSCEKQPAELLRHVMAHELGHAYDTTKMSDAKRTAYLAARGIPTSTPWYGCTDFATPAGDFAEVYAQWARRAGTNRSEIAGDVGGAQLAALAATFFGA